MISRSNASSFAVRAAIASILGTSVLGLLPAQAFAAEPAASDSSLEEVQITGSRIRRTTDFNTANPTTVIDADYFKNLGIVNVGDAVRQLPSNVSNNSPTTTGNANFFAGSTLGNLRGLNPFFGSRTLNLVNGRRHVPTNQGDGVDLNFIPTVLIQRMDVVTGGASAAYGSGAISGVNNVFLNTQMQGARVDIDYGTSSEGDADDRHIGAAFGSSFANDRGNFVFGVEWQDSDAVQCIEVREWCRNAAAFVQNPDAVANGGSSATAPTFILRQGVRNAQLSSAGVWQNFAAGFGVPTLAVNNAGLGTIPFNVGTGAVGSPFNSVVGGDGRSAYEYTNLRAPVERKVIMGALEFALTDSLNLSVEASHGRVETTNITGGLDANFTLINADNAFLTPALAAAQRAYNLGGPPAAGFAPAFLNKDWTSQIDSFSAFNTEVSRFAVGLDGRFGDSTWTWDAYYQFGQTDRSQLVNDNRHLNRYNFAVDAIVGPNGQPICRVTQQIATGAPGAPAPGTPLYQLAQGCVPLNPFGTGPIDPLAKDYAFGYLLEELNYKQQVLSFNTSGDLSEGFGAGAVKAAVGVEYRTEKGQNLGLQGGRPDVVRTDYLIQYGESFAGDVDVIEAYGELDLPLLRDRAGAQALDLNLAARYSRYENQGGFGTSGDSRSNDLVTWKASLTWDPVEWLKVRATQSRDARAANFRELYYGQKIQAGGVFGFCGPVGSTFVDNCNWSLEGNVNLTPEKSDTTTVGLVFTPDAALPGFQFAVDYFRIKISDAIQQANVRRVLDGCQVSNLPEFCNLLELDGTTYTFGGRTYRGVENLRALAFNGSGYNYRGFDLTGTYRVDFGASALNFRLIATRMLEQSFQPVPGQPFIRIEGQTGTANAFLSDNQPTAKWIGNLSATWVSGPLAVTGQMRYVGSGVMNYFGATPGSANYNNPLYVKQDVNDVPSYSVFGLNGSYTFEDVGVAKTLRVWASIDNLTDKTPPVATGTGFGGAANGGTNPVFFDTIGRYFRVGVSAMF